MPSLALEPLATRVVPAKHAGRPWEAALCGPGIAHRETATTIGRMGSHGWADIHGTGLSFGIVPPQMRPPPTGAICQTEMNCPHPTRGAARRSASTPETCSATVLIFPPAEFTLAVRSTLAGPCLAPPARAPVVVLSRR